MKKIAKLPVANKILLAQLSIVVIISTLFFISSGLISFKSALYGGIAVLIPNIYFAYKVNQQTGQEAKKIVRSFYAGESGKIIITALIFGIIFQDSDINIIAMLVTYISALTVFWFALLIRKY